VTESLLLQQLESPSGTGRVEPRKRTQPVSYRHQPTGCQPANPFSLAVLARCSQDTAARSPTDRWSRWTHL